MIRSKKKFVCSNCGASTIKFSGYCTSCNKAGTIQEVQLLPEKIKPTASAKQKSLRRRYNTSERNIGKRMLEADGADPVFKNIATSTGRIGHITNIRADTVSKNYIVENKNRTIPKWIIDAWILILQKAEDFQKHALLHLEPPNLPKEFPINGVKKKTDTMAVIQQSRHESLIVSERHLNEAKQVLEGAESNAIKIRKLKELLLD